MARKRIICSGMGALNAGPHFRTSWDDVWLKWQDKPGRKTYRAAPCLMSMTDLDHEIEDTRSLFVSHPDMSEYWQKDLDYLLNIKQALETQPYFTEASGTFPNTYTRAEFIDRAEAERMLRYMLRFRYGVMGDVKFVWRKLPKLDGEPFYMISV